MFEIEKFSATSDWRVYCFGAGGRNELIYICKLFNWSIFDFVNIMSDKYNAELKLMKSDSGLWIFFKWKDFNRMSAWRFYSDLKKMEGRTLGLS